MVVKKHKKKLRMRGSTTHGWGSRKMHRGAGNRGGRGMAGTGKRGDAKKPSIWGNTKYFGKYGFKRNVKQEDIKAINIIDLEKMLDSLLESKLISKDKDFYDVDLAKLGFQKLLGDGRVTKRLKIRTKYASKKAVEKISKAGGEVILPKQEFGDKKEKMVEEVKTED